MAIKALTPGKTFVHVSRFDKRPEKIEATEGNPSPDNSEYDSWKPTKWKLKCLDGRVIGVLKDKATKITMNPTALDDEVGTEINQHDFFYSIVSLGLDDEPENYETKVKFKKQKRNIGGVSYEIVTSDYMGTIPTHIVEELAEVIEAGNTVSAEEGNA